MDELFWQKIRNEFVLSPQYIHLNLCLIASPPKIVREAIQNYRNSLNTNPGVCYIQEEEFIKNVYLKAGEYLETDPDLIALTENTTSGLGVVYSGMKLDHNDEILTTPHEHYSALELFRFLESKTGVRVNKIPLYQDPRHVTKQEILNAILSHITKRTRIVALTWVHSCTGLKLPLKLITSEIAKINKEREDHEKILVCVDGVHGLGIEDFSVENLGCDFFIAGCHKCLFGPRGTGLVWGTKKAWSRVFPIITSFDGEAFWPWFHGGIPDATCPRSRLCSPGGFHAFEHRWALSDAFDFHLQIGKKKIADRVHELNTYIKKKLNEIRGLRVYTPDSVELSSGLTCFEVENMAPDAVVKALLEKGIVSGQTPYQNSCNRFSIGIIHQKSDIDKTIEVLRNLN